MFSIGFSGRIALFRSRQSSFSFSFVPDDVFFFLLFDFLKTYRVHKTKNTLGEAYGNSKDELLILPCSSRTFLWRFEILFFPYLFSLCIRFTPPRFGFYDRNCFFVLFCLLTLVCTKIPAQSLLSGLVLLNFLMLMNFEKKIC